MKMKYTLCLLAALTLAGCAKTTAIHPADTVAQMQEKLTFTDQMAELDKDGACRVYGVDASLVEDCAGLRGSGATAESFSVWEAVDADSADKLEEQLEAFLDSWIEGYSDYKPEEVPKLESAVLEQEGKYVILCVSADNEAAEPLIEKALHP